MRSFQSIHIEATVVPMREMSLSTVSASQLGPSIAFAYFFDMRLEVTSCLL